MTEEKEFFMKSVATRICKKGLFLLFFVIAANAFGSSSTVQLQGLVITVENAGQDELIITKSEGNAKELRIPDILFLDGTEKRITAIGNGAFSGKGFTKITLPTSITSIGDNAFAFNSLKEVEIPGTVTIVGRGAFTGNRLESINFVKGSELTEIGKGAFSNNIIKGTLVKKGDTSPDGRALEKDEIAEGIIIPDNVTVIDDYAFLNNRIPSVTFNDNLEKIGKGVFSTNKLIEVNLIENNVSEIGDGAFYNNMLEMVSLPAGIKMGKRVFDRRSPGGVTGNTVIYTMPTYPEGRRLETPNSGGRSDSIDTLYNSGEGGSFVYRKSNPEEREYPNGYWEKIN
jgi:hypothetical protein